MTDKKRGGRRSDRPPEDVASEIKAQRAEFVQKFFRRGAELTDELVRENKQHRQRIATLERENAALKTQLASDAAMRDLLKKIKQLETEKLELLSSVQAQEEVTNRFTVRFVEIEAELENFANLYVASYQLHSTLRLASVVQHLKELLLQLVGARSLALFARDASGNALVPIVSEAAGELSPISLKDGSAEGASAAIERAYLTGVPRIVEGDVHAAEKDLPLACVPIKLDDDVIGVIVVYALLPQKRGFVAVDFELFKLLGLHAATALVGAQLYELAERRVPALEPHGK